MADRLKRLQRLLSMRERVEKQAQLRLALGLNEDKERRLALEEAGRHLSEARGQWEQELREGIGPARWSLLQTYMDQRHRDVAQRERLVEAWSPRLAALLVALRAASRERQGMERWRDRLAAHRALEENRAERHMMDEIGLQESLRRGAPEHGEE